MMRRNIIFKDEVNNKLYVTPEFNGDKEEFEMRKGCLDGCFKNWDEILQEFEDVKTLKEFKDASERAQNYYHSFLGLEILPIEEIEGVEDITNNEIYLIEGGDIIKL